MDDRNYLEEYFLGLIPYDEAMNGFCEQFGYHIKKYIEGAFDFMEFLRDYYEGEPVYPSEMELLLLEFFQRCGQKAMLPKIRPKEDSEENWNVVGSSLYERISKEREII